MQPALPVLPVLFEDNHLLVVEKPAGLLSQSDTPDGTDDVLNLAREYIKHRHAKPGAVWMGLVHRLDREVGGVMVLARTSKAASRLSDQIRKGQVRKRYAALVMAPASAIRRQTLEHWTRKDSRQRKALPARASDADAKLARLHVHESWRGALPQIQPMAGGSFSAAGNTGQSRANHAALLEIELETGRFHQIRFQLSQTGMPILGDRKYGANFALPGVALALHCVSMSVRHPTRDETLQFTSPAPSGWGLPIV